MQRALLLSAVLFFLSNVSVHAQKSKDILGEWVYGEPLDKEKLDAKSLDMMNQFFSSMRFAFAPNGTFKSAAMGKAENGTWKMDAEGTHITLTPSKGDAQVIHVKDLNATTWLMEMEPGKGFKMVRGER